MRHQAACYGRIICVLCVKIIYGHAVVVMRGVWGETHNFGRLWETF
jgi:hypothetical protein